MQGLHTVVLICTYCTLLYTEDLHSLRIAQIKISNLCCAGTVFITFYLLHKWKCEHCLVPATIVVIVIYCTRIRPME